MPQAVSGTGSCIKSTDIALPPPDVPMKQDQEWCVVDVDGQWKQIRFHDYDEVYAVPGLYETLFYDILKCTSPARIREMLLCCIHSAGFTPGDLRVLDLGAGNGMVGEELACAGIRRIIGVDIMQAAAKAAHRDRAEFYEEYYVLDMTDLSGQEMATISEFEFNCLVCVAALGFGDIPPVAFANAYNLIDQGGWITFNIKSEFLASDDPSGFASLISRMMNGRLIDIRSKQEYRHRLSTNGEPLMYTAFVGTKKRDIPAAWQL
jgi:hypothetical protein